jgi:polysaccharide deacetylase family protein (PEP-CTERM system associated)
VFQLVAAVAHCAQPPIVMDTETNAFSVDIEDWYQVSDFEAVIGLGRWDECESRLARNTDRLLALLADAGVHGTFFVLTWNAERYPAVVRGVAAAGHEIACHGYAHRLIYDQTPETFRADVSRAKATLEDLTGTPVLGYRAPSLSITPRSEWALDVLLDCGFHYDSSVIPIRDAVCGFPDTPRFPYVIRECDGRRLVEFPISTARVFGRNLPLGGGGYLRVFPYHYMAWGMRRVNRIDAQPAVFYIHPWEVDPDQPRMQTAGKRGFSTHYVGLGGTEAKLRRLLRDFRFAPVRDVLRKQHLLS